MSLAGEPLWFKVFVSIVLVALVAAIVRLVINWPVDQRERPVVLSQRHYT